MADWQKIETAPKDGTLILTGAFREGKFHYALNAFSPLFKRFNFVSFAVNMSCDPTHWQPLPVPPIPPYHHYAHNRATEALEAASSPADLTRTDAAQAVYDEAYAEAAQDYDRAAQLWRVTIGDWDMRFERVAAVFGTTLADAVGRENG